MRDKSRSNGFLDRWSERKRESLHPIADPSLVDAGARFPDVNPDSSALYEADAHPSTSDELLSTDVGSFKESDRPGEEAHLASRQASVAEQDAPLLTDDDMPPINSLSSDSDLSDFFNKGVSAALRKAALRHVFQQPVFNVRDGLNDYDGDYTVFEPLGDTVTSDMKWHIARKERERLEALELEEQERLALEEQSEQQTTSDSKTSEDEEVTEEAGEESAEEPAEEHAEEPAKEPAKEPTEEPAKEPATAELADSATTLSGVEQNQTQAASENDLRADRKTLVLADSHQNMHENGQDHEQ